MRGRISHTKDRPGLANKQNSAHRYARNNNSLRTNKILGTGTLVTIQIAGEQLHLGTIQAWTFSDLSGPLAAVYRVKADGLDAHRNKYGELWVNDFEVIETRIIGPNLRGN